MVVFGQKQNWKFIFVIVYVLLLLQTPYEESVNVSTIQELLVPFAKEKS